MKFPEMARRGSEAHTSAVERLHDARERQHDLAERAETAKGTAAEEQAADALRFAHDRTAAREAWLVWIERGL